jgi:Nif-specific regulatory protein
MERLCRHDWPGNVRELRNVVERGVVLGNGSTIEVDDLAIAAIDVMVNAEHIGSGSTGEFLPKTLDDLEREHIMATLKATDGNKSRASTLLGIERSTLDRKLKRYRLEG